MEKEMSDACVVQWSEQSADNRKTWARSQRSRKRLFFHRKIFKFFKYLNSFALLHSHHVR